MHSGTPEILGVISAPIGHSGAVCSEWRGKTEHCNERRYFIDRAMDDIMSTELWMSVQVISNARRTQRCTRACENKVACYWKERELTAARCKTKRQAKWTTRKQRIALRAAGARTSKGTRYTCQAECIGYPDLGSRTM